MQREKDQIVLEMNDNQRYNKLHVAQSMTGLWDSMKKKKKKYLVDSIVICKYSKNEAIYNEDEDPQFLLYVLDGKVKVYKTGMAGKQQIVRMIKPKEMFGYRAAFASEKYITGATAFENTTLCQIPINVIKKIIVSNAMVGVFFLRRLASMLGGADALTVTLTQKHIRARLAEAIITIKDKFGVEDDGKTLSLSTSREDIANIACMTTSNAIRTLSALAQEGVISLDGRNIRIENEAMLHKISQIG